METKKPSFDYLLCVSCSVCVQACPISCIELSEKSEKDDRNLYPAVGEGCTGCGTCERACPMYAISTAG